MPTSEAERVRLTSSLSAIITSEYRNSEEAGYGNRQHGYRPWISGSSLLRFPCDVAPVWFMVDSDKRGSDGHVTERSWL